MHAVPLATSLWMVGHMAFALLLGWMVGYERYFSGRAAGSQVYCLVSATSCAITLLAGVPSLWYGGGAHPADGGDPTRVIGALMTGIGFLGAGLIVQSGTNVRGLTTAASIWSSSAIGILVGAGFHLSAIGLTALFVSSVALIPRLEQRLPGRAPISASLRFRAGYRPSKADIDRFLNARALSIPQDSVSITSDGTHFELQFIVFAGAAARAEAMNRIALEIADAQHVERFTLTHSIRA